MLNNIKYKGYNWIISVKNEILTRVAIRKQVPSKLYDRKEACTVLCTEIAIVINF